MTEQLTSEAARELSKLGAKKGGRARASTLTPEERSEISRHAVNVRWEKARNKRDALAKREGTTAADQEPSSSAVQRFPRLDPEAMKELPFSMFRGNLQIGDMNLECHVLNDERRVFTQREVVRILSHGRVSGNLSRYLERNPLYINQFSAGPTIDFKIPGSPTIANGYEATLLIEICELYLEARRQKLLKPSQMKLAIQSEIIMRSCAKVGIIALIDEATGFQEVRKKRALQIKLQAFIAEEMQEWARMFPEEFWYELARLESIHYSPRSRPLRWGKYVMMFVYDAIDADVGKALREKNPDPHFLKNHHQWLKEFGRSKVNNQIQRVIAVMKLCGNMEDFRNKFAHVFKKAPLQLGFDDIGWGEKA